MSPSPTADGSGGRRRAAGAPRTGAPEEGGPGVLGSLPRTRPQRPSARRAAARRTAAAKTAEPPAPPQGFEAEEQIEPGRPVQPPSGPELAASVAELLGDLAQTGFATAGRVFGDALKRLSGG